MNKEEKQFTDAPRDYVMEFVDNDVLEARLLLLCCLKYMSADEVRDMLDLNELSPRFLSKYENN